MQSYFLHYDPYPLPCIMLHTPTSDEAVLMFVTTYTQNFEFLENWQRTRLLHILEHSLHNPHRRPKGKMLLKELYEFAEACIGIWRKGTAGHQKPIPPSQELLRAIPKAEHVVIPSAEQFGRMMDDLGMLRST
jgi:hypothetical protein